MLERHRLQVLARIAALVLDEASEGISVGCSESQEGSYVDVVALQTGMIAPTWLTLTAPNP